MNRKKSIVIWIVPVLFAITVMLFFSDEKTTMSKEGNDFAVEDTSLVTKILISNNSDSVILERIKVNQWRVNNKYYARQDAINVLLSTIYDIRPYIPVAKNAQANVKANLKSASSKILIYNNDDVLKSYYVGGHTQNVLGTYMIMEDYYSGKKSDIAYITHIPGFNGYLTTRYFISENKWRNRVLFSYEEEELINIEVKDFQNPEKSFTIKNNGDLDFELTGNNEVRIANVDTSSVNRYLLFFKNVQFEAVAESLKTSFKDSVLNSQCIHSIEVNDTYSKKTLLKTFLKKTEVGGVDMMGNPIVFDTDRLYVQVNNSNELLLAQYYIIDKLLKPIDYFVKE